MAARNGTVAGRSFYTEAEYEAALRDQKKIASIKAELDLNNPEDIRKLYDELTQGFYRFESLVGDDFDDEIYELFTKSKEAEIQKPEKKHAFIKGKNKEKGEKKKHAVSLQELDESMRKEIEIQLKIREKRRRLLIAACSLMAVICFAYFLVYYFFAGRTSADYEQLAELKNSEVLQNGPKSKSISSSQEDLALPDILTDYQTLYNKNKKLIGWLKIDDTIIDYPIMQTSNNEYYLDHNFNQEYDKNGSIFMDAACKAWPRSQNLILYGHHMKSGQMFGDLEKYAGESYYKKHKNIQFDTIYEKGKYEVMYVFRTKVLKETDIAFKYYQFVDAISEEEFNSYMREMQEMSLYETGVTAVFGDELLTLSTCDNSRTDGRFVVVAKRIE